MLRSEWEANAPCDDEGENLPYPGNWEAAQERLIESIGGEWGQWEITGPHEIEIEVTP